MDTQTKKSPILWVIIGILVLFGIWCASFYNKLVTMNEGVDSQWAQVETQYQRRLDLIPNLVESVKGVMKQEGEIFGKIADARTHYANATSVDEKAKAAGEIETSLSRLLVIMENYPALKSADNVNTLMAQLEGTENRVSTERGRFNDTVQKYNVQVKQFPGSIIAPLFGFHERTYFDAVEGAQVAPAVKF